MSNLLTWKQASREDVLRNLQAYLPVPRLVGLSEEECVLLALTPPAVHWL